jgi:hypothetical protein
MLPIPYILPLPFTKKSKYAAYQRAQMTYISEHPNRNQLPNGNPVEDFRFAMKIQFSKNEIE